MDDEFYDEDYDLDDYYAAGYEPPFSSVVQRLEPEVQSLEYAVRAAEELRAYEVAPIFQSLDQLDDVEQLLYEAGEEIEAEARSMGMPTKGEALEMMSRHGEAGFPIHDLEFAGELLDEIDYKVADCHERVMALLGTLNRAQRRGAQIRIDAAFEAIVAGNIWAASAIAAEVTRDAVRSLEPASLPEPPPPVQLVDLPRPDAERQVDALVAAAAAPPR